MPATSAALAGSAALASVEVMPTVSVELTTFQLASTALTVAVKAAARGLGGRGCRSCRMPLPGAAVSPGIRICSFENAPALTVVAGLVFAVIAPFVTSVAVNVGDDAVFGVTEKVLVPATSAAFAGSAAFGSVEVIPTVSVDETGFQFASTALTVTVNAEPAVCADGAAGLAGSGAGGGRLTRQQELQLRERAGNDRDGCAGGGVG